MRKRNLILLLGAALVLTLVFFGGTKGGLRRMEVLFALRQQQFFRAAQAALADEAIKNSDLFGSRSYNVWSYEDEGRKVVDFSVGAGGFGSQTRYWGFYTTTDGAPAGFHGMEEPLTASDGKWIWREADGDNTYTTWQAADNWYYYLMTF